MISYAKQKHTMILKFSIVCLKLNLVSLESEVNLVGADQPNNIKRGGVCIY